MVVHWVRPLPLSLAGFTLDKSGPPMFLSDVLENLWGTQIRSALRSDQIRSDPQLVGHSVKLLASSAC